ncbi:MULTISPECIES: hypothetical protein [unclassified Streptomyces]|uniref:hypothetical protein n=1 Tax=unclassified Streptomyces TaxID=2593676 RepID=UPI00131B79B2|nr:MULTISPECIES: hypothetical protein [unclassified Streptomyces]
MRPRRSAGGSPAGSSAEQQGRGGPRIGVRSQRATVERASHPPGRRVQHHVRSGPDLPRLQDEPHTGGCRRAIAADVPGGGVPGGGVIPSADVADALLTVLTDPACA